MQGVATEADARGAGACARAHQLGALAEALRRLEATREAMTEPEGAALHRASLALLGSFCAELQREARKRLQADDVCAELTELQASS